MGSGAKIYLSPHSVDLKTSLRNVTQKSSLFSNHLFAHSMQTDYFEIGKIDFGQACAGGWVREILEIHL
jgi:hypothetical protein